MGSFMDFVHIQQLKLLHHVPYSSAIWATFPIVSALPTIALISQPICFTMKHTCSLAFPRGSSWNGGGRKVIRPVPLNSSIKGFKISISKGTWLELNGKRELWEELHHWNKILLRTLSSSYSLISIHHTITKIQYEFYHQLKTTCHLTIIHNFTKSPTTKLSKISLHIHYAYLKKLIWFELERVKSKRKELAASKLLGKIKFLLSNPQSSPK